MNEIKRYPSYTHITWVATLLLFKKDIKLSQPELYLYNLGRVWVIFPLANESGSSFGLTDSLNEVITFSFLKSSVNWIVIGWYFYDTDFNVREGSMFVVFLGYS